MTDRRLPQLWLDSFNSDGKLEVQISDQTTPTVILPMVSVIATTTLSADAVKDAYTCSVTSATGLVVGQHFRIIDASNNRYYYGSILVIAGTTITLDTPLDYAYPSGAEVTTSTTNMAVNGSVTPVVFGLRTGTPSIPSNIDITRMIIVCTCNTAVDLNKFGNLAALTRGIVFRRSNGDTYNIFNAKANKDLAGLAYDFVASTASNPAQGVDGFYCRLTFAGTNKLGVALRIVPDGNLEMVVQDDLTGLVSLNVILEGHVVQN